MDHKFSHLDHETPRSYMARLFSALQQNEGVVVDPAKITADMIPHTPKNMQLLHNYMKDVIGEHKAAIAKPVDTLTAAVDAAFAEHKGAGVSKADPELFNRITDVFVETTGKWKGWGDIGSVFSSKSMNFSQLLWVIKSVEDQLKLDHPNMADKVRIPKESLVKIFTDTKKLETVEDVQQLRNLIVSEALKYSATLSDGGQKLKAADDLRSAIETGVDIWGDGWTMKMENDYHEFAVSMHLKFKGF